ncbi:cellulase family glycosylhydrolase [Nocardioides sp. Leaf285]|uniref:cellulase family glycosylhydrolase n=1 Tax=Nocardioides sp. Leaf285 TaxID=1736322 RepID=UPI0012EA110E|nr:cellulase family glycosylhydrolase [Nocardioides sp. Leaf285]
MDHSHLAPQDAADGPKVPRSSGRAATRPRRVAAAAALPAVGVQFHGMWSSYTDTERKQVLQRLKEMGATWIRLDISWAMLQPQRGPIDAAAWGPANVDRVISMARAAGLKVLGTLWLTPAWANGGAGERVAPTDPADYGRAFAWAAERWQGKVAAWEVWNEPNSADFLVGADPAVYTGLLCSAYRSVASISPRPAVQIVYGGTMHNDTPWIEHTYRAGAAGCFDVMATHPYQAPADRGPLDGDGAQVWDFTHLGAVKALMTRYSVSTPVWVTEFGWSSHPNTGREANWERGVSEAQQADHTLQALRTLRDRYPFVTKAFVYNEREKVGEGPHQAGFGILRNDLSAKPIYRALKRTLTETTARRG